MSTVYRNRVERIETKNTNIGYFKDAKNLNLEKKKTPKTNKVV